MRATGHRCYMYKLYRIPARPYWDHWQTGSNFVATALMLGSALILLVGGLVLGAQFMLNMLPHLAWVVFAGVALEGIGLMAHARDLKQQEGEGVASHFEQRTRFGNAYVLRNVLLLINLLLVAVLAVGGFTQPLTIVALGSVTLLSMLAMTIISRALFYVLVIPTTMPGTFFWKNRAFEEHARKTGLANMPQVGVVPDTH